MLRTGLKALLRAAPSRLEAHERGQMAITFVLVLFALFMFFALAFDAGLWYFAHRGAQAKADAAALAGVQDLPSPSFTNAETSVNAWLVRNLGAASEHCASSPDFSDFDSDGNFDTARVCVRYPVEGVFSRLSGLPWVYISAVATARIELVPTRYALMAMDTDEPCDDANTLYVFGGADVNLAGEAESYTRSSCPDALHVQGTSSLNSFGNDVQNPDCLAETTGGGAVLDPPPTCQDYLPDPFSTDFYPNLTQPPTGAGPRACKPAADYDPPPPTRRHTPGWYCDELVVNNQREMAPGVYVFERGLRLGGNGGLSGDVGNGSGGPPNGVLDPNEEVLLYNTCPGGACNDGAVAGNMFFQGSGVLKLQGIASLERMAIWVDRDSLPGCIVRFRGTSAGGIYGMLYAYECTADIGGTPGVVVDLNMSVVADQIEFQGDATFNIEWDPNLAIKIPTMYLIE